MIGKGKDMPSISVIIPVYNAQKYIRQCLNSVCNQTLQDLEIICVDDGSTDNSYEILLEYQSKDKRIHVYQQKNQYAGVARNNGMRYATGKYFLFLDADDYFYPTLIEKLYKHAEKNNLQVTLCQYDMYFEDCGEITHKDYTEIESMLPNEKEIFNGKDLVGCGIFQLSNGWAWDKLFLREYVLECGYQFPSMRSSEDGFFAFMLMARAERIGYIRERLITYRLGNQNSLSATKDANWENGFLMLDMIFRELNRLGIYELYRHSFLRFVVEFEIWYMDSMNEKEAYAQCFYRIQEEENKYQILQLDHSYCATYLQDKYERIVTNTLEQFLFSEVKVEKQLREKEDRYRRLEKKGWLFPFTQIPKNKRILLYGAGSVGKAFYKQLSTTGYAQLVIWVDRSFEKYDKKGLNVVSPEGIDSSMVDYAVIAISNFDVAQKVKRWLMDKGIEEERIIE